MAFGIVGIKVMRVLDFVIVHKINSDVDRKCFEIDEKHPNLMSFMWISGLMIVYHVILCVMVNWIVSTVMMKNIVQELSYQQFHMRQGNKIQIHTNIITV